MNDLDARELQVDQILLHDPVDLSKLHEISRQCGGFLNSEIRRKVWPKLTGVDRYMCANIEHPTAWNHPDAHQVKCDIDRSLWNIDCTLPWSESFREKKRNILNNMILTILSKNKNLHYYQGYHDVASIFMLTLEDDSLSLGVIENVSRNFLADFMAKDFEVVMKLLQAIPIIIECCDPELTSFFSRCSLEPYFTTSWLITWFAHDLKCISNAARVYDAILCSPSCFVLYLCAAVILCFREEIVTCEEDFAIVHNFLSRIPETHDIPFEKVIQDADRLMKECPPYVWLNRMDRNFRRSVRSNRVTLLNPIVLKRLSPDWKILKYHTEKKVKLLTVMDSKSDPQEREYQKSFEYWKAPWKNWFPFSIGLFNRRTWRISSLVTLWKNRGGKIHPETNATSSKDIVSEKHSLSWPYFLVLGGLLGCGLSMTVWFVQSSHSSSSPSLSSSSSSSSLSWSASPLAMIQSLSSACFSILASRSVSTEL